MNQLKIDHHGKLGSIGLTELDCLQAKNKKK